VRNGASRARSRRSSSLEIVLRFEIGLKFAISAEERLGFFRIGVIRANLKSEGKEPV